MSDYCWELPPDEEGAAECDPAWPDPAGPGLAAGLGWQSEPGLELMCWCFQTSARAATTPPGELVDAMGAFARFAAWAAAGQAQMIAALYDAALERHRVATHAEVAAGGRPLVDESDVDLEVTTEVALALGMSPRAAGQLVWFARDLAEHPALAAALAAGRIDPHRAQVILTEVRVLPAGADRAAVVARLVGPVPGADDDAVGDDAVGDDNAVGEDADSAVADRADPRSSQTPSLVRELLRPGTSLGQLTIGRLRSIVAREVLAVDAEAARRAADEARRQRRVWERPVEHSMGELTVRAGAEQTAACWTSVDAAARAARASGDVRTLDQLRSDIAVGRLTLGIFGERVPATAGDGASVASARASGSGPVLGLAPTPAPALAIGALTNLTMAVETYLGLDDRPAILHSPTAGPIPLPPHIARALAHDPAGSYLRRVLTAPATGVAWDVSGRYRTPGSMAAFVKVRDGYRSRLPVSGASRVESDHVVPYDHDQPARGGPTTPANLQSLGHRDHRWKTIGRLRISGNANDVLEIVTPAGKRYLSYPEPYHDPEPG